LPTGYFIKDIRCLAHIINLIVQDILSEIKGTITQEEYINISRISEDIEESAIILPTTQLTIQPTTSQPVIHRNKRIRANTEGDDIPINPAILSQPPPLLLSS